MKFATHQRALPEALLATQQHLQLIQQKRDMLTQRLLEAQNQFLVAVRREIDAGNISWPQLAGIYDQMVGAKLPLLGTRWVEIVGLHPNVVRSQAKLAPNAPDGSWQGVWPMPETDPHPLKGRCVVYVLFDDHHNPIYVGSTGSWKARMKAHSRDGKRWSYWVAHPCADREAAYARESDFLRQYMPSLNVQGPRREQAAA